MNIDTMGMIDQQKCQPVVMVGDDDRAATDLEFGSIGISQSEFCSEQARLVPIWIKRSIFSRFVVFLM